MKYLAILLILTGCGMPVYFDSEKPFVVKEIRKGDNWCFYQNALYYLDSELRDTCGKFQIGDTIKLTK